jgi:hypothetical protein
VRWAQKPPYRPLHIAKLSDGGANIAGQFALQTLALVDDAYMKFGTLPQVMPQNTQACGEKNTLLRAACELEAEVRHIAPPTCDILRDRPQGGAACALTSLRGRSVRARGLVHQAGNRPHPGKL